jgi:hypothetical protein
MKTQKVNLGKLHGRLDRTEHLVWILIGMIAAMCFILGIVFRSMRVDASTGMIGHSMSSVGMVGSNTKVARSYLKGQTARNIRIVKRSTSIGHNAGIKGSREEIERSRDFIKGYVKDSPLVDHVDDFYKYGERKAKLALAIAGNESLFGTYAPANKNHNAWGYLCNFNHELLNCGWDSWDEAIGRYMTKADVYLKEYDGTRASMVRIADMGYYPVSDEVQNGWANRVNWFINQL